MRWLARRIKRTIDDTERLAREPGSTLRGAAVRVWRARGGGFYGLGYLITFVALQVRSFAGEVATSAGVSDFVLGQVSGYLLRVTVESFANVLYALLWPLLVAERFGLKGVACLGIGYLVFERWVRMLVERSFPDLRRSKNVDEPVDPAA